MSPPNARMPATTRQSERMRVVREAGRVSPSPAMARRLNVNVMITDSLMTVVAVPSTGMGRGHHPIGGVVIRIGTICGYAVGVAGRCADRGGAHIVAHAGAHAAAPHSMGNGARGTIGTRSHQRITKMHTHMHTEDAYRRRISGIAVFEWKGWGA